MTVTFCQDVVARSRIRRYAEPLPLRALFPRAVSGLRSISTCSLARSLSGLDAAAGRGLRVRDNAFLLPAGGGAKRRTDPVPRLAASQCSVAPPVRRRQPGFGPSPGSYIRCWSAAEKPADRFQVTKSWRTLPRLLSGTSIFKGSIASRWSATWTGFYPQFRKRSPLARNKYPQETVAFGTFRYTPPDTVA